MGFHPFSGTSFLFYGTVARGVSKNRGVVEDTLSFFQSTRPFSNNRCRFRKVASIRYSGVSDKLVAFAVEAKSRCSLAKKCGTKGCEKWKQCESTRDLCTNLPSSHRGR